MKKKKRREDLLNHNVTNQSPPCAQSYNIYFGKSLDFVIKASHLKMKHLLVSYIVTTGFHLTGKNGILVVLGGQQNRPFKITNSVCYANNNSISIGDRDDRELNEGAIVYSSMKAQDCLDFLAGLASVCWKMGCGWVLA